MDATCRYCNGGSLADAISAGLFSPHFMPNRWKLIVHILSGVVRGMTHMHTKRILHGDLNPANVLLKVRFPCDSTSLSSQT